MTNPNADPGALAGNQDHHEGALMRVVHGVGHVVAEGASVLLTPYSHGAERNTGLNAVSPDRFHHAGEPRVDDLTAMQGDHPSWLGFGREL